MEKKELSSFKVIGISVRTTNENNQAGTDIVALWDRFMKENVLDRIPNKLSNDIYSIYTDYESDHTKPYTTILGCQVSSMDEIPEGMISKTIETNSYQKYTTEGDLTAGIVYQKWLQIWEMDIDRNYSADFEIYGQQAQNPKDAKVDIFIAVN